MQMGVRMYSPQIGRFLAVDPLFEMMPGHNPYHYAFNSPLMFRDPSGMAPVKEKHSEKLQGWVEIEIDHQSTPIMPGTIYMSIYFPDWNFADWDAGFAEGYLWGTNLSMMGNKGGTGGGDGSGCPYYGNSNSKAWGGITRYSLESLCNITESIKPSMRHEYITENPCYDLGSNISPNYRDYEMGEVDKLRIKPEIQQEWDYCYAAIQKVLNKFYHIHDHWSQNVIMALDIDLAPGTQDIPIVADLCGFYLPNDESVAEYTIALDQSYTFCFIRNAIINQHPIVAFLNFNPPIRGLDGHTVLITKFERYLDNITYFYLDPRDGKYYDTSNFKTFKPFGYVFIPNGTK